MCLAAKEEFLKICTRYHLLEALPLHISPTLMTEDKLSMLTGTNGTLLLSMMIVYLSAKLSAP